MSESLFNKVAGLQGLQLQLYQKETPTKVFPRDLCEINTHFPEHSFRRTSANGCFCYVAKAWKTWETKKIMDFRAVALLKKLQHRCFPHTVKL